MSTMPWDEQEKDCQEPTEIWVVEGRINAPLKPWRFARAFRNKDDAEAQCEEWNCQPPQAYAYRVREYLPAALAKEEKDYPRPDEDGAL